MNRRSQSILALAVLGLMTGTASADTIKVGVIGTMSGPYALFGKNFKMGIDAWVAEHGTKAGKHDVEFIYRDEEGQIPPSRRRWRRSCWSRTRCNISLASTSRRTRWPSRRCWKNPRRR